MTKSPIRFVSYNSKWLFYLGLIFFIQLPEELIGSELGGFIKHEIYKVSGLTITGAERTDTDWLKAYLDLPIPALMNREDAIRLKRKIMTTGVYREVKVVFDPISNVPESYNLHIHLEEKWTTIPVIRAVFGGGIPLRVFGMYETHFLGRLFTLGGEMRQYGTAPPGYVVYWRNPRAHGGRSYYSLELWREFRRRWLFDEKGVLSGDLLTNLTLMRARFFQPLTKSNSFGGDALRFGCDAEFVMEAQNKFHQNSYLETEGSGEISSDVKIKHISNIPEKKVKFARILPSMVYDNIELDLVGFEGFRVKVRSGPIIGTSSPHGLFEIESYGYKMLGDDFNFAGHAFGGYSTLNSAQSRYYLGGLDSVRGFPDGFMHGTRALHASFEARYIMARTSHLWLQSVAFIDGASTGDLNRDFFDDFRSSVGIGFRVSVPQVNRLMLRLDYAWSRDGSGQKGITAGMGQFFDPYTPL